MALQGSPADHAAHVCGTSTVGSIDLPSRGDFPRSSIERWANLARCALVRCCHIDRVDSRPERSG
jgi:hypothetical protein